MWDLIVLIPNSRAFLMRQMHLNTSRSQVYFGIPFYVPSNAHLLSSIRSAQRLKLTISPVLSLLESRIFFKRNGVQLHTAYNYYHSIVLIELKYC